MGPKSHIDELRDADTGRNKKITVSLTKSNNKHILEVTDNGRGVDEDIREKLFKRFASKKTGGWGVGLYNCNVLVQSHSGSLNLISRKGVGTTFRMELPDSPLRA